MSAPRELISQPSVGAPPLFRDAVQGARRAVWCGHTSNEQRSNAPGIVTALRVGSECGARFPVLVAKGNHPLLPHTARGSSAFRPNASHRGL